MMKSTSEKFTAFLLRKSNDLSKARIETMDYLDGRLCYGDNKGFIYLVDINITDTDFKFREQPPLKISKAKIDHLEILKVSKFIAVLSDGKISLVDIDTFSVKSILVKSGVTMFAGSSNDYIAIASGKKITIQYYDTATKQFLSIGDKKPKEFPFPEQIIKMAWNGDLLGVAHKKAYGIVTVKKGAYHEFNHPNGTLSPNILVFNDSWVVVSGDTIVLHEKLGNPLPGGSFQIQTTNKAHIVHAMLVKNYYLLVFKENAVHVFNLLDCSKVQTIDMEPGFQYKDSVIENSYIILAMDITSGSKKEVSSSFQILKEVSGNEQIKQLLLASKVPEAHKIFLLNFPSSLPDFEQRKENFNINAAWALFANLLFPQSYEYFMQTNYDPRELLALVPNVIDARIREKECVSLGEIIEKKLGKAVMQNDPLILEGTGIIINLLQEKRKYLAKTFNIDDDAKKIIDFINPENSFNNWMLKKCKTLEEIMYIIDTTLIKLHVESKQLKNLQNFLDSTPNLKCNFKEMDQYLKEKPSKEDPILSSVAQTCQAYLFERAGNIIAALDIWKQILKSTKDENRIEICKPIISLMINKVEDKKIIKDYMRTFLVLCSQEAMKVFIDNDKITNIMTQDDIVEFLTRYDTTNGSLKEQYLEYLIRKPGSEERFHTQLGLHYVGKLKDAMKKEQSYVSVVVTSPMAQPDEALVAKHRQIFADFLKRSKNFNTLAILDAINGLGLLKEEIILYSLQGKHKEALEKLVENGSAVINFADAEKYCLEQSEPLLAMLFGMIIKVYETKYNVLIIMQNNKNPTPAMKSEQDALSKYVTDYENYCKGFLKRYASNEKMDAEAVLLKIPDHWIVKGLKDGKEDESLFNYLVLTINDRLSKFKNYKIAAELADMEKTDLDSINSKMQQAFVIINAANICKVCGKTLGAKAFHVFPNGIVTHTQCAKDVHICPVTNINFSKKVYDS